MSRKSPVYVEVRPKKNEDLERMIRRFVKKVKKAGIIEEVRERSYYEKPSVKRNRLKRKKRRQTQDRH